MPRNFFNIGRRTTVIPDQDNQARTSQFNGERFVLGAGDSTSVDGEPVLTFADDRVSFFNFGSASTTGQTSTVLVEGDRGRIFNAKHAEIEAEDTGISVAGTGARITNLGSIDGGVNGVNFLNGGQSSGSLTNFGTISSDSRAVNIGGNGISINNFGDIVGTGDQRNGTIYSDGTAENYTIVNQHGGTIDAGEGNDGAGIALQTGDTTGDVVRASVINNGDIAGRGQAAPTGGTAGDGVRLFAGADDATFRGTIVNNGNITSESTQGPVAGVRISDGLSFDGTIVNGRHGEISGANNGLYFGNADHDATVRNFGTISSDSRAVNIDGSGVDFVNFGDVLGTGNQRNGTVYSDATADDYSIVNQHGGTIDAGEGNDGAGIALQTGDTIGDVVNATVVNNGDIAGRGQAEPTGGTAGDGVRLFAGADDATFRGTIVNNGNITSESTQGPVAGVRISDGLSFDGTIVNGRHGEISGANNGLYFGNADHDATVRNFGTISSDSRAVNIDGSGVDFVNFGDVLGTGNQRNGTIYSDATAEDYSIVNQRHGTVDAGEGNQGAGIALQTGDVDGDVVNASIVNRGDIAGRGQGAPTGGTAGDGIRLFSGTEGSATFRGDIINSGEITSESAQGPVGGIRVANGLSFDGTIENSHGGLIAGANNGLYFGTGDHDATVRNFGTISSDSRAVNIDGSGVDLFNFGDIEGTGNQRNGTVYADATAEDYSVTNLRRGDIDAGDGNNGSGVSLQTGDVDGDVVSASVTNFGDIRGRGDAEEGNTVGDGVRIFSSVEGATFEGDITNAGRIEASEDSDAAVGISIEDGVTLDGRIVNTGRISANETAIDATEAGGRVVVENRGRIDGDVNLSDGNDLFFGEHGTVNGTIDGGAGNDSLNGGRGDDVLAGGAGNDALKGGGGRDVFVFAQSDTPSADTVVDFSNGRDRFDVSDFGFSDFSEIGVQQVGSDTVLTFAEQNTATLSGVNAGQIDEDDFVFSSIA